MDWLEDIKPEELPEQYQEMFEVVCMECTLKLARYFGKTGFYFVGLTGVIGKRKEEYILNNFKGNNHKELARIVEYSERKVYQVLKKNRYTKAPGQLALFRERD